jgi:hypothetical protein
VCHMVCRFRYDRKFLLLGVDILSSHRVRLATVCGTQPPTTCRRHPLAAAHDESLWQPLLSRSLRTASSSPLLIDHVKSLHAAAPMCPSLSEHTTRRGQCC